MKFPYFLLIYAGFVFFSYISLRDLISEMSPRNEILHVVMIYVFMFCTCIFYHYFKSISEAFYSIPPEKLFNSPKK